MSELISLRISRGQIKARLTRESSFLENLNENIISKEIIHQLESRLDKLEPVWDDFKTIQSKIDFLTANEDGEISDSEQSERENFEDKYFWLTGAIRNVIDNYYSKNKADNKVQSGGTSSGIATKKRNVNLPIITLQPFDGKLENWGEFHDAFLSLVHNNDELDNVCKFYYLRNSLTEEPAKVIKAMKATDANYQVAWHTLKDRYENNGVTIQNHIRNLWKQPGLTRESHIELRNLLDNTTVGLRQLETLGEKTDGWDSLIIYMLTTKFDPITSREWESHCLENKNPNMKDMTSFLNKRCKLLQKLDNKNPISQFSSKNKTYSRACISTSKFECYFCKLEHSIYTCEKLLKLSPQERYTQIKALRLCVNCLRPGHLPAECKSSSCKRCNKKHNSLLHIDKQGTSTRNEANPSTNNNMQDNKNCETTSVNAHSASKISQALLSTAVVQISDSRGKIYNIRVLLDSGAQSNFCTERLCEKLNLTRNKISHAVSGIGKNHINIEYNAKFEIKSQYNSFKTSLTFLVVKDIAENLPVTSFDIQDLNIPKNIDLADPSFNVNNDIDILLGCQIFWQLLRQGQLNISQLSLQKTVLGWIVGGSLKLNSNDRSVSCLSINEKTLSNQLQKFWLIEENKEQSSQFLNDSDLHCENYFLDNYTRDNQGRFTVKIPFKDNKNLLGESRQFALERFQTLERKLIKDNNLKREYKNFMLEYIELGHMVERDENIKTDLNFYLPHHAVVKESSLTTRTRVVFDASMKTTSGLSLNDIQYNGPNIQGDLFNILLRFRMHKYAFTGDVSKMYRQIRVSKEDRAFQRVFWRPEPSDKLKCYELTTVSYGTASAAFLAVRCLHQLADENATKYPHACSVIKEDFYVDDVLTGSNTIQGALQLQRDIQNILASGGILRF